MESPSVSLSACLNICCCTYSTAPKELLSKSLLEILSRINRVTNIEYENNRTDKRDQSQDKDPTKVHLVKAMVFAVVMNRRDSWTIKKAERQRINAFELWFWRRLLGILWNAWRSNQSIIKEISSGCSLVGLILKLKLQYFGHLM